MRGPRRCPRTQRYDNRYSPATILAAVGPQRDYQKNRGTQKLTPPSSAKTSWEKSAIEAAATAVTTCIGESGPFVLSREFVICPPHPRHTETHQERRSEVKYLFRHNDWICKFHKSKLAFELPMCYVRSRTILATPGARRYDNSAYVIRSLERRPFGLARVFLRGGLLTAFIYYRRNEYLPIDCTSQISLGWALSMRRLI